MRQSSSDNDDDDDTEYSRRAAAAARPASRLIESGLTILRGNIITACDMTVDYVLNNQQLLLGV